jgi:HK97 family phage major capsid protein
MGQIPSKFRNAITTDAESGGSIVPSIISSRFIDLARAASVCVRAGAESIDLPGAELKIGRIVTDPTVHWRAEAAAIGASTPVFGALTMRPKVAAVLIPLSLEWVEDSVNGSQVIEQAVSRVLGQAIDAAALAGDGSGATPTGIIATDNVNERNAVGTPTTYAAVSSAIGDILSQNYDGDISALSWILPPALGTTYDQLKTGISGDNTPLQPTGWVSQLQRFHTTSLAVSGSPEAYSMIVGNFRELLFGFRMGGVRFQVLQTGTVHDASVSPEADYNALTQMLVYIRAFIRFDVGVMRPGWFTALNGVQAA